MTTVTDRKVVDAAGNVRSATVSVTSQLGAKAVHLVLNVVSTLAIVRCLAPGAYGTYVLVLTVTTLAGVVADFGLAKLAVREMVRLGEDEGAIAGSVIAIRLGLAVVAVVGCQVVVAAFGQPPAVHLAAAVASLVVVGEAVLGVLVVAFQIRLAQQYEALVRVVGEAVETSLVLVLVARGVSLPWLFVPPVVGIGVALVLATALTRRRYALRPRVVMARIRPLVVEAGSLGPALLVGVLYLKLDQFVVAALRPDADLGTYGAACQPIEYLFLGMAVFVNVLFPLLARAWGDGDRDRFLALYRRGTEVLVIVTGLVAAVTVFIAPALVRTAFGSAYSGAAAPLGVLSVALVVMTVNGWQSLVLLSGGHQRVVLRYNLLALGVDVVVCVGLVHFVGIVGAAVSVLATGVFVLVASTRAVGSRMHVMLDGPRLVQVLAAAVGTAVVAGGLTAVAVPWLLVVAVAAVVYLGVLGRFGFHRTIREALA